MNYPYTYGLFPETRVININQNIKKTIFITLNEISINWNIIKYFISASFQDNVSNFSLVWLKLVQSK